ncbi:MAG: leucyl aminopeptidase [Rickettsiales bacterium]|nr:leucyl aminopeptidase [Rickettsiales bacterium]
MKVNFIDASKSTLIQVQILTEEELKKSKSKAVHNAKKEFGFSAKLNESQVMADANQQLILIGAGKEKELDELVLQKIGATCFACVNSIKAKNADVVFSGKSQDLCNIAFGALLKSYRFNKYFVDKKKSKELKTSQINFVVNDEKQAKKDFKELEILAENIFFTRDLVSEPSNELNPESYAKICQDLKKDGLEIQVLGEKEMTKLKMNALLGVGQGSRKESKLVILTHNGGKKGDKPLAFVGKGVTFDTGGISIKPSTNMEDMKTDMGGSAVVVGLMRNLAQRKAKVNAVGVIGLVENMPDGMAQKPGDVVTSMSGQTIEIINTDAEGRLVLADALHYTNTKFKPKFIVDLATLTGAIVVALADVYGGLFANDDKLADEIIKAGETTNERAWRLPVGKEYDEMINSDIADMKNVGAGRGAGSTTAAQFLKRFVGETKWAHLDIAGVAWKGKGDSMAVKGATGYGVRLLNELVKNYEK